MKFITSNESKIQEIQAILPDAQIVKGKDLEEVLSDSITVAMYKALAAGAGFVIEDTILEIDGVEVVDIKWKLERLQVADAKWLVHLGYNDGETIYIYRGIVPGIIIPQEKFPEGAFGFDPYFFPEGSMYNLFELKKLGLKNDFSARKIALEALRNNDVFFSKNIAEIPEWSGQYQKEM